MWHIIGMLIIGLIAGALARLILPGKDPMGLLMTMVLGIVGSFVGGFFGNLIFPKEGQSIFRPGGLLLSILGAILVLWIWRMFKPHTGTGQPGPA
jgi:uncharacterized membrane protein YeaQ/YmgE (transglycosylase-associated protein family)